MQTIGDRISCIVDRSQLKKSAFAAKIGISPASLSTILSGKTNPSRQTILSISREFHVNHDWLVTGEGSPDSLDPLEEEIAAVLSHAITHNSTAKDRFLRAASLADEETLQAAIDFMLAFAAEITRQTEPAPESEDTPE